MYNASDRKDIRRAEKASKAHNLARADFIRLSMGSSAGRAWFHDLLSRCHLFHVMPPTNPLAREFCEGERNVGIQIYNDILTFCPDLYLLMIHEAQTRDLANARSDPDLYTDTDAPAEHARGPGPDGDTTRREESDADPSGDDGWPDNLIGYHDE